MILGKISTKVCHTFKCLNQKFLSKSKIPHIFRKLYLRTFYSQIMQTKS